MMIPYDYHYRIDKNKIRATQVMGDQEFTGGGGGQVFFHPRTGGARTYHAWTVGYIFDNTLF